jgi:K+-sensing histidine kinase KdpD
MLKSSKGKGDGMAGKRKVPAKAKLQEEVAQLRALAHDLSNALEAILQASYLLSHGRLDTESKRWAHLIETSSEQAARINREIRKLLRSLGEK